MLDKLEENFKEQGLPSCTQLRREYLHRRRVQFISIIWQFISVRDYSNAKCLLAASGFFAVVGE